MTAYLIAHPPRIRQFRERRRKPTGCIVLHTAESNPDEKGPDTGTDGVASFIRNRTTYGSYHRLADSDSHMQLVPDHLAAYGDGTGSNDWAIHVSGATQAAEWKNFSQERVEGFAKQMARAAAESAKWLKREHNIVVPARRITRSESERGLPGFISHGERDPGRRSDPGKDFPWGVFLQEFRRIMFPPAKPTKAEHRVRIGHISMQFSDPAKQMESDLEKLFGRAKKLDYNWLTGTESGGKSPMPGLILEAARDHGFRPYKAPGQDCWIAVNRDHMRGGVWQPYYRKVVPGKRGDYGDKGPMSTTFNTPFGRTTVIAGHLLTGGRPGKQREVMRRHLDENRRIMKAIGDHAIRMGRGSALVFYGGDQNIIDRTHDTFLGAPLTTAADELKRWQPTHQAGGIDAIGSYDGDGRVRALRFNVLDDKEFSLHTDHFLCEALYGVKAL